jgi:hypothetical protein
MPQTADWSESKWASADISSRASDGDDLACFVQVDRGGICGRIKSERLCTVGISVYSRLHPVLELGGMVGATTSSTRKRLPLLTAPTPPRLSRIAEGSEHRFKETTMARKTVFVSDLSGKEIGNDRDAVTITVKYGDARKGVIVVDAHPDDSEVKRLVQAGRQQARRGRRPKSHNGGESKR